MMKKRCVSILLVLCMVMTLLPTTAWAAEPTSGSCGDNVTWTLGNGVLTISGTGDIYAYYYAWERPWHSQKDTITSVIINSGVTRIGVGAFYGFSGLTEIVIPEGIARISSEAFSGCDSLANVYYGGSKAQWYNVSIAGNNDALKSATIHYNSTGPDDVGPDNINLVYFLSGWDPATKTVQFGDPALISPDTYTVADSVDVSNISSLLNKYVLVTMKQGDSSLEYTITDIQPVESKIGTVSTTGEHSLTIDGTTYPVQEDYVLASYDGDELLYHVSNGTIMGFDVLEEKTGTLEAWDSATGKATIDSKAYPTNYISILPDNMLSLIGKKVDYSVYESIQYSPILKLMEQQNPLVSNHIVDIDWGELDDSYINEESEITIVITFDCPLDYEKINNLAESIQLCQLWERKPTGWTRLRSATLGTYSNYCVSEDDPNQLMIYFKNNLFPTWDGECNAIPYDAELSLTLNPAVVSFQDPNITIPGVAVGDLTTKTQWGLTPDRDFLSFSNSNTGEGGKGGFTWQHYALSEAVATHLLSLTKEKSSSYNKIRTKMTSEEWIGSCEGMSSVMGQVAIGQLEIKAWDGDAENCYEITPPKKDRNPYGPNPYGTSDLINYYQLIQYLESYPRVSAHRNAVINFFGETFAGFIPWNDMVDQIVEKAKKFQTTKEPFLLGFDFTFWDGEKTVSGGHCCLAYGYEENTSTYIIRIYDPSAPKTESTIHIDKQTHDATIHGAWHSDNQGNPCNLDLLSYVDVGELALYNIDRQAISHNITAKAVDSLEDYTALYVNVNCNCEITNKNKETLIFKNGKLSGTMPVYGLNVVGYGASTSAEYRIYVANSEEFICTATSEDANFTVYQDGYYYESGTKQNGATITVIPGKELKLSGLQGCNYKIYSSAESDKGDLVIISGRDDDLVKLSLRNDGKLQFDSDNISNTDIKLLDGIKTVDAEIDSEGVISPTLETHLVSFNPTGGTIDVSTMTTGTDGKLSNLPVPIRSGYTFDGWYTAVSGGDKITTNYIFTSNTTVYAHWTKNSGDSSGGGSSSSGGSSSGGSSSTSYSITAGNSAHGSVSVSPKSASKGTRVTLTIQPDSGYTLESLVVKDNKGNTVELTKESNAKYTFTMPNSKVTIDAAFIEIERHPSGQISFTDVSSNAYYYQAVAWAVEQGITAGTSAATFSPDASCTRAQTVTFLWRAAGSPAPQSGKNPFTDVQPGTYYYDAVLWAVEQGITVGTSSTAFSPDATVTRGQTVTFLYRTAGSPAAGGGNPFGDVTSTTYYANAVQWAVDKGVTAGTSTTTFSPNADCTRAQIVTFLYRDRAN